MNSLKDELTRLVAAVSSSGFDCDVCILDDSGDIDRLFDASKKKENYVEGANHLWFTFADSTHISLLILLQLFDRNNHERNSVTIIDHCRSHNANEYAFARHAEQVLLRIRDQEYTGDVGAYCNRIIADCRSRFMSEYPTGLKCLPYYPSRGCSVGEYFGGERILLEYYKNLMDKCRSGFMDEYKSQPAALFSALPLSFFANVERVGELRTCLKQGGSDDADALNKLIAKKDALQATANKKNIKAISTEWRKALEKSISHRLREMAIVFLPIIQAEASRRRNAINEYKDILDKNFASDPTAIHSLPNGIAWYNFGINDLLDYSGIREFENHELNSIMQSAFSPPSDGSTRNWGNRVFMNNGSGFEYENGNIDHLPGMPLGLILSGRIRHPVMME